MRFKKILIAIAFVPVFLLAQQDSLKISTNSKKIVSAPVILNLDTLFFVKNIVSGYPVEARANRASERLQRLTENYSIANDSIVLRNTDEFVEVLYNNDLAFIVTPNDAKFENLPIHQLAEIRMNSLISNIQKIESLSTKEWLIRIGYFTLSLLVLIGFIKLVNFIFRKLNVRLSKIEKTFLRKKGNILKYFIPNKTANIFVFISNLLRVFIIIVFLLIFSPFMFSFFPWAEHVVDLFYGYISSPIKFMFFGFIDFIPSLFFIVFISILARYIVRVGTEISQDVEDGVYKINNFHRDWAKPTSNIFSILIYVLSLIFIFPYLPGSGSSAFQGISIFIGAIISFGSTSAIANIIAGIVITYMRSFKIGDRVKIDNVIGDVIEKSILITRLRTLKNEDVTIPNANILMGNIINYTNIKDRTIILHTKITLGYDLAWQTANKLLLEAASKTKFTEETPEPFVLQTSLDDYYVTYELNVHTKKTDKLPFIYSEIHKNILEVFDAAGIEILSPAYQANRDGNLTTVPSKFNPEDKSPINKLVDHMTGRNQKITIEKSDNDSSAK